MTEYRDFRINNQSDVSVLDRKTVSARARMLLSSGENRLTLLFSLLIWIGASVAVYGIQTALLIVFGADGYIGPLANAVICTCVLIFDFLALVLLILPLLLGIYCMAVDIADGRKPQVADMFCTFGDAGIYDRAVAFSLRVAFKYFWAIIALTVFDNFFLRLLTVVGVGLIFVLTVGKTGLARMYLTSDSDRSECRGDVRTRMCGHKSEIRRLQWSFVPWILLSFATIGVLFLIDTIPYMMLSNAVYAGELEKIEIIEGSVQDEQ